MKNTTGIILGVIILIALIWGISAMSNKEEAPKVEAQKTGTVYVGVTDQTTGIKNVSEIELEVKKVEIWSETSGWVTVSESSKNFPLLKLKADGTIKLFVKAEIPE